MKVMSRRTLRLCMYLVLLCALLLVSIFAVVSSAERGTHSMTAEITVVKSDGSKLIDNRGVIKQVVHQKYLIANQYYYEITLLKGSSNTSGTEKLNFNVCRVAKAEVAITCTTNDGKQVIVTLRDIDPSP